MSFKDEHSSKNKPSRLRWPSLGRKRSVEAPPTSEVGVSPAPGLSLRADNSGNILEISEGLKRRLSIIDPPSNTSLPGMLANHHPCLQPPLSEWPDELPIIKLLNGQDREQAFTCSLVDEGDNWLLVLVDIDRTLTRLEQHESHMSLWNRAIEYSAAIHSARSDVGPLLAEWLEDLSLRLDIAWSAAVLYDNGAKVEMQCYFNPTLTLSPPDLTAHCQLLESTRHGEPFCINGQAGEVVWCLPHENSEGAFSWLCLGQKMYARPNKARDMEDLSRIFAMVAEPALLQLQQKRLRQAMERYSAFELLSHGGWWEYRRLKESLSFSKNLSQTLGIDTRGKMVELPASEWLELVVPADRDELRMKFNEGGPFSHSFRFLVDGNPRWFRAEGVYSSQGEEPCIMGVALDVDDLHLIEEEAEKVQARISGLVDSAPGIIYIQTYDDGQLTLSFCSGSLQDTLGWTLDEYLTNTYAHYIHAEDRERYFSHLRSLLREGSSGCQYRVRDRLENFHWVQDEARLIRDDRGIPIEAVGLCLDITQNKLTAERVRRSEERYRALVEDSPAIIFRYTPNLQVTSANRMLYTSLSVDPSDTGTVDLREILSEDDSAELRQRLESMTHDNALHTSEISVRRRDGQLCWWEIYERAIFDGDNRLLEVQAVARDNTDIHEARRQMLHSAKMATLGQMATGLTHEIAQPLNVIHMAISNLIASIENGDVTDDYLSAKLNRVVSQISRAEKIVDHMRIFGRQSDIKGQLFNPKTAVENALSLLEVTFRQDDVEVVVEVPELADVLGYPDRLEQVLINLMSNATAAAVGRNRAGSVAPTIWVSAETRDNTILIRIKDNGGGVPDGIIDRIFEPFFTTKPAGEGTGLGLSISYAIVRQMSGNIHVYNDMSGAVFSIKLPIAAQ